MLSSLSSGSVTVIGALEEDAEAEAEDMAETVN
jgi:hypothetical protein